jgi:hypothetical protein
LLGRCGMLSPGGQPMFWQRKESLTIPSLQIVPSTLKRKIDKSTSISNTWTVRVQQITRQRMDIL